MNNSRQARRAMMCCMLLAVWLLVPPVSAGRIAHEFSGKVQSANRSAAYVRIDGGTYYLSKSTELSAQNPSVAARENMSQWIGRTAQFNFNEERDGRYVLTSIYILGR